MVEHGPEEPGVEGSSPSPSTNFGEYMVYWITGKRNAGKTTYSLKLKKELEEDGSNVLILDGDGVRKYFPTGYTDDERRKHILRVAKFAAIAEEQNIVVIIAMIAPMKKWRMEARKFFEKSMLVYIQGGELWAGTTYEEPDSDEKPLEIIEAWKDEIDYQI